METPFENCPVCGGRVEQSNADREIHVGKRSVTLGISAPECAECGEYFLAPHELDEVQSRAAELIRKEDGLLFPEQIVRIREQLGLSQARFEQLLGVGPKTVVRWERGTVFQNAATDNLIRVLADVPEAAVFLARRQGVVLTGAAVDTSDAATPSHSFAYSERKILLQLVRRVSESTGARYVASPDESPGAISKGDVIA